MTKMEARTHVPKPTKNLPMEKPTVPAFWGVTLAVNNMEESVDFYRNVLGFDVDVSNPVRASVRSKGGAVFGLFSAKAFGSRDDKSKRGQIVPPPFPFHLEFGVEDLEGLYQRVKARRYSISEPAFGPWGGKAFFAKDPDGYILQFHDR